MAAYYNEIDPYCAQWLRNLIAADHIAPGDVDERDIRVVSGDDLRGYAQCHFFAGIGGWSHALRLAGWDDVRPVWTGSCPCQPFSAAGKRKGQSDPRHLWPQWYRLIRERIPATIFGEQVDDAVAWGWLDDVFVSLESDGYACGAVDFPACSVGATHVRQRLYFCAANADKQGLQTRIPERLPSDASQAVASAWREFERIHAAQAWREWDAKSAIRVFSDGIPNRVGRLRAYGNAIVPQVAAEFIRAYLDASPS